MSAEENKAIVRRTFEEFNKGKSAYFDFVDKHFSPDYVHHQPPNLEGVDREAYKQQVSEVLSAFPDLRLRLDDMIAEADKVAARFTARGTHLGELQGIAPTGKQVTVTTIHIRRIEGGKIVEAWEVPDQLGMMQQLGLIPSAG